MGRRRLFTTVATIALAAILVFSVCPMAAADHNYGENWTYEVGASIEVGPFVVHVTGNITYEFLERRTIVLDSQEHDTCVLSIEGNLSGQTELFGRPYINASVSVDGFLFQTANGAGVIKKETNTLIDATVGSGSVSWVIQSLNSSVVTYTPPYLSKFDVGSDMLGSHWTEEVAIDRSVTVWENGTELNTVTSSSNSTYEVTVGTNAFEGGTTIGYFECIMLTIVDEDGNYEERWWSDEVHGYVQMDSYLGGTPVPYAYETNVLVGYDDGESGSMLWVIIVGICITIVAAAVLVVVLRRAGRPKGS